MVNPDKLEGWAQIEGYLGISRNTILARGYPIRKDGGVFAYKPELDKHGKSKPIKKPSDNLSQSLTVFDNL